MGEMMNLQMSNESLNLICFSALDIKSLIILLFPVKMEGIC